mmetsp:Transcript_10570/g.25443  ORF Transcript_10570/g.25443 Transcript_10570/m.25443 type:complete len:292 (+) Transcript_10570:135-1010(+)
MSAHALDHLEVGDLQRLGLFGGIQEGRQLRVNAVRVDDGRGRRAVLVDEEPEGCAGRQLHAQRFRTVDHVVVHVHLEDVVADHVLLLNARGRHEDPPRPVFGGTADPDGNPPGGTRRPTVSVELFAELSEEAPNREGLVAEHLQSFFGRLVLSPVPEKALHLGGLGGPVGILVGFALAISLVGADPRPSLVETDPSAVGRIELESASAGDGKHMGLQLAARPTRCGLSFNGVCVRFFVCGRGHVADFEAIAVAGVKNRRVLFDEVLAVVIYPAIECNLFGIVAFVSFESLW